MPTSLVQFAQIIGGFASALGVVVALVGGFIALTQLKSQQSAHREREYTALFAQYVSTRAALRVLTEKADFDFNEPGSFEGAKFGLAQMLRFIRVISDLSEKAGAASSSSDWVLLADDADYINSVAKALHAKAVTTMTMDLIDSTIAASKKTANANYELQVSALKGECERIIADDSLTLEQRSEKERALVGPHFTRMQDVCKSAGVRMGIREGVWGGDHTRQLMQLSLILSEAKDVASTVNDKVQNTTRAKIAVDRKRFGQMNWGNPHA